MTKEKILELIENLETYTPLFMRTAATIAENEFRESVKNILKEIAENLSWPYEEGARGKHSPSAIPSALGGEQQGLRDGR